MDLDPKNGCLYGNSQVFESVSHLLLTVEGSNGAVARANCRAQSTVFVKAQGATCITASACAITHATVKLCILPFCCFLITC
jgi:hypothetical protein